MSPKVWRCRWCGRRVHGVFGWFHKPVKCSERSVYPKEAENEGVAVSLPVCPECDGLNEVGADGKKATRLNPAMGPCPACGGSGVDITEAVEAAYEVLKPYLAKDMPGWVPGWQVRVARRVALAVLDKEGTSVVSGEGE